MYVESGTVAAKFLFWEYLFPIFGIGSLQCRRGKQLVCRRCQCWLAWYLPEHNPEAEFLDVKSYEFSSVLFKVTSTNGFYSPPPPPPNKSGLKYLVCNVTIVYGNLKSEISQYYAQKPQWNCTFINSASGCHDDASLYVPFPYVFFFGRWVLGQCVPWTMLPSKGCILLAPLTELRWKKISPLSEARKNNYFHVFRHWQFDKSLPIRY